MEYTKLAVVQLLLLGSALAQQHFGQQPLRQPPHFQQAGFQPSAGFPQQQQQQRFQQQPAFRAQQQQPEQFSTFGEGVESFKQINNRPLEGVAQQPALQQTRTQQFAARPVAAAPAPTFTQQQPLRAAPVAAPAAFQAAPAPAAAAAAAAAPVELPHALGAPAEQHDAQVFVRRPQPGAPVQVIPTQQAEAVRIQQENERLQAETQRIQQENARIKAENQRIQQDNLRFRQESQQQQQQQQQQVQQQQAQQQLTELINQQDAPQQEAFRVQAAPAPVQAAPVHQPTRSRGLARRPAAAVEAAPKPVAAPVRVAPVRVAEAAVANPAEEELFEEQAKNAQYTFASSVDDKLTDNSQVRQETRDGLNLAGLYSYSDGFFRRTVHYEADENGYRVVKEEVEPIGNGPQLNPNGAAEVQAQISGQNFGYRITADDIKERKETERVPVQQQQQRGFRQLEQDFSQ